MKVDELMKAMKRGVVPACHNTKTIAEVLEAQATAIKWMRELDREHKDENPCPDYALRAMYRKNAREALARLAELEKQ